MVAIRERQKFYEQNPRRVAALDFVQEQPMDGKLNHGNNIDEQRVPQGNQQWNDEIANQMVYDYLANAPWLNYPVNNNNVVPYPVQQQQQKHMMDDPRSQGPARQSSMPNTESLDRYLHPELDIYNGMDYGNIDLLGDCDNENFSVDDLIDLDKVDVCEQDGINFDLSSIKQEKLDAEYVPNLEDMETVLDMSLHSTNGNWMRNLDNVNQHIQNSSGNQNSFPGTTPNINGYLNADQSNVYNTDDNGSQWHSSNIQQTVSNIMQPTAISQELVVKTESTDTNNCDNISQFNSPTTSSTGIPASEDELVDMPVSRFNELLLTLSPEQSCEAKDIRRRGKNKKAARLCRKRKIVNISSLLLDKTELQQKIDKIRNENVAISSEIGQLKMNIDNICRMLANTLPS